MTKQTNRTKKIAIFLDIPGLARSRAISGLYRYARRKSDWRIFQFQIQRDSTALRTLAKNFRPDAIFAGHADAVRAFALHSVPYVLLENIEPRLPDGPGAAINGDNVLVGRTAADKLHGLGYRNFAYLGMIFNPAPKDEMQMILRYSRIRGAAFERRIRELGCTTDLCFPHGDFYGIDEHKLSVWLKALKKPCGLFAFSDEDAQYVLSICRELRISVPKQLGIIGVDNEEFICDNVTPPLTSIEPDYEGAGYRAGELLDEFLSGNRTHVGTHELYGVSTIQNRMSAQSVSSSANRVSHALEIIRADPANAPAPTALAQQMNLSLRVLEIAFKQILGHGVTTEVLTQRLNLAKRLIKTSRLNFYEIALKCGFSNYPAFLASFKRRIGQSPREWRNS